MNFKWFRSKLTFLIIPGADESVVRFKLSRGVVCCALLSALLAAGSAACLHIRHLSSAASTFHRTSELSGKAVKLEQALQSKDRRIEELQSEVFALSRQAAEVRMRIEAMKKLERDLHQLAPGALDRNAGEGAAALPLPASQVFLGMGGPNFPAEPEDTIRIAAATGHTFTLLEREIDRIATGLSDSRSRLLEKRERQRRTPSLWPTVSRIVTSSYGYREDPFTGKLSFHRGIDIAGKLDDPVFAAASGVVHQAGYDKLHGHHVIVEHSNGLRTWYMHLNQVAVTQGEQVEQGQTIGGLGTTGRSTGPHLHYEVLLDGKSTDPRVYLPSKQIRKEG
ncbi:Peptidase family M23 [Paenibacillus sp. UNCCL117]|uniref:M23 family metallopeptidase n=1 Tax=unclassified Paenibacillus TaxID=185978 RepID=UPI000887BC85|nr:MULTISPECIES: M23 family metallopeptidase [unclassified Paenibacillus]SDE30536.1 Peptidase family M23 [Paenibacillus sp. cl123]SFW63063.1 Peptidase family M23 [Paenibacillus sp. UNCCL117]